MKKLTLILSFIVLNTCIAFSQINVTATNSATQLAQTLVGFGVTISNATLNCGTATAGQADYGSGEFTVDCK